jgi:L-lactate dehydrogenase
MPHRNQKTTIAIIGAGNVGAACGYTLAIKNLAAKIILIDVNEKKEAGEVMDIADALSFMETGTVCRGQFSDAANADIIILTAGARQKEGQTRLDLLGANKRIFSSIFSAIGHIQKDAVIIVVSNPVDILTHFAQELSGLETHQVFGTGTALDTARLRVQVGKTLQVSPHNVHGFVLGEHGDSECISWDTMTIGNIPAKKIKKLTTETRKRIGSRVKKEAYEIIERKGATFYGIASTVADIVESIIFDQKKIIPVSTRLTKWNGVSGVCLGVPAVLGQAGVERVWPLPLNAKERENLHASAKVIKEFLKQL